ncbi:MAG: polysaccharide biosynthesis protein [Lachnospiraceae bacterium]|nr:polysaccharide biosynthesis protein [Lachnospiraceae bacterium]
MKTGREKSKFNNFIVQGGILAIAGVTARMLGLFKRVPQAYIIGDYGNSYYAAAYEIYNIIYTISVYGLPISVSKLVSANVSKGQYRNADKIFKCSISLAAVTGLITSVLVFLFSDNLSRILNEPMSFLALRTLAPTLFVVSVMGVLRGYFQGLGSMVPTAVSQLLEQVVLVAVSLTAAFFMTKKGEKVGLILHNDKYRAAYGASGITLGCLAGAVTGLVFLGFLYSAYRKRLKKQIYRDPSHSIDSTFEVFKTLLLTIIPIVISSFVNNISNFLDQFLHNRIMIEKGLEEIKSVNWGIYSGKYSVLIGVPIAISAAMGASSVPTISGLMKRKEYDEANNRIERVIRITMMIAIPCCAGMIALAPSLMWTLFSVTQPTAYNLVRIGAAGVVLFSFSTLTNAILQGMSRLIKPIIHGIASLCIHVVILVSLLKFTDMNIYAVALSNNFFSLAICIMNIYSISKILKYRQEVRRTFALPVICASIMGAAVFFLDKLLQRNGYSRIMTIVCILIGALIYFVGLIVSQAVGKEEITAIPGGTRLYGVLKKIRLMN